MLTRNHEPLTHVLAEAAEITLPGTPALVLRHLAPGDGAASREVSRALPLSPPRDGSPSTGPRSEGL